MSITTEVANEFVERLCNGILSNIQFNTNIKVSKTDFNKIPIDKSSIANRLGKSLASRIFVIWIGFAGMYSSFNTLNKCSFNNMNGIVDSLYFSLVTMTTTGYGEILPTKDITKLLVITQLSLTWVLIIVMILHYGMSVSENLTEKGLK